MAKVHTVKYHLWSYLRSHQNTFRSLSPRLVRAIQSRQLENKRKKTTATQLFDLSATHLICVLGKGSSGWPFEMMFQVNSVIFFSLPHSFSCSFTHNTQHTLSFFYGCLFQVLILMRYYLMSCYFITWIRIAWDAQTKWTMRAYVLYRHVVCMCALRVYCRRG